MEKQWMNKHPTTSTMLRKTRNQQIEFATTMPQEFINDETIKKCWYDG